MKSTMRAALSLALASGVALAATGCASNSDESSGDSNSITITTNAISGGKNAAEAEWLENWVIPNFTEAMKAEGQDVEVNFEAQGVDDEDYKTKVSLDLSSGKGADIVGLDGIWIGEFSEAGYIKPLDQVAGDAVEAWDGWDQMSDAVKNSISFDGEIYGVPMGADGRVVYFNKDLFKQAGLPTDWQPQSWEELLEAARTLKTLDGVTPLQLNAGTAMGEATSMQGVLPILAGAGQEVWQDGKWAGDTQGLRDALQLYKTIYVDEELGDPILQQEASGRDTSFQEFAAGKIGILIEGDYFWRSVVNPAEGVGTAPMENRDEVVGYAKIPSKTAGAGVGGQDFVSMSGGTGRVLNPNSDNPELAWKLLEFMNSAEAYEARYADSVAISPRTDVNDKLLSGDSMLSFVSDEVLPLSIYRPGLAAYPQVSTALQQATLDVVTGASVDDAVATYVSALEGIVGADAVSGS